MTRSELYIEIAKTITEHGDDGSDIFCSGDSDDCYKVNRVFNLVTRTKDPELAWELLKLYHLYDSNFFMLLDEDYDFVTSKSLDEHIDYIKEERKNPSKKS